MTTVPSRELKNRLGKYLKLVKKGETVQVTDRGRPIACIVPLGSQESEADQMIAQLVRKGGITFGSSLPIAQTPPARMKAGKPIADMVAEDRR
jgi:prevent-host-death family protein